MSQKHDADNIAVITTKNCISKPHATFLQKPPRLSISNLSQERYPWNPWNQKASIYSPQGFKANSSKGQIFPHLMMSRGNTVRINWSSRIKHCSSAGNKYCSFQKRREEESLVPNHFPVSYSEKKNCLGFDSHQMSHQLNIVILLVIADSWKVQTNCRS